MHRQLLPEPILRRILQSSGPMPRAALASGFPRVGARCRCLSQSRTHFAGNPSEVKRVGCQARRIATLSPIRADRRFCSGGSRRGPESPRASAHGGTMLPNLSSAGRILGSRRSAAGNADPRPRKNDPTGRTTGRCVATGSRTARGFRTRSSQLIRLLGPRAKPAMVGGFAAEARLSQSIGSPRSSSGMMAVSAHAARIQACTWMSWRTVST